MTAVDRAGQSPQYSGETPTAGTVGRAAAKPRLRGWMHLILFEASLVLGTLALSRAHGAVRITALAVFTASVSAMLGASALYHRGSWSTAWHRRLQRVDHAMIFLLIAGTATPAFLVAAHGSVRIAGLAAVWALTLTACLVHMVWMNAPERLVGGTFVALGCVAGLGIPEVWRHSGAAAGALMLAGGLLYIAGALSYHRRWPDPVPAVFGFHEVFHVYVSAAAACQYTAIALFII
ncbi:MAG TPA: hemolysin III family protein [Trebonia sp.]|nr:hemolysin III family protein [Trebonia sp.]